MTYHDILLYIFKSEKAISDAVNSGIDVYSDKNILIYKSYFEYLLLSNIYNELGEALK